jgi:transcriptional regulator with XRE-family HTH domain
LTNDSVGRLLAAIRAERGLTRTEPAMAIGRLQQTVGCWESGRSPDIRSGDLCKIAVALGCRLRDLLAPVEAPIPPLHPHPRRRRRTAASVSTSE